MTRNDGKEVRPTGLVERLAKTIAPLTDLRLIVIDPAARFRGGEENAAEDTTRFVEAIETLAKRTGAAVLVVHHTNKVSMQGGEQNQSASRGSSALTDGVRLQINSWYPKPDELKLLGASWNRWNTSSRRSPRPTTRLGASRSTSSRDDAGRLFPVDLENQKKSLDVARIEQIVEIVRRGNLAAGASRRAASQRRLAVGTGSSTWGRLR